MNQKEKDAISQRLISLLDSFPEYGDVSLTVYFHASIVVRVEERRSESKKMLCAKPHKEEGKEATR